LATSIHLKNKWIGWSAFAGLFIAFIVSWAHFSVASEDVVVSSVSIHQVKERLKDSDVFIIDVRSHQNWWRSRLKILTAVRELPTKIDQWAPKYPKNKTLILY
jgi:hypothetical protein